MTGTSEDLVLIVGALYALPDIQVVVVTVVARCLVQLVLIHGKVVGIHDLYLLSNVFPAVRGVEVDLYVTLLTTLRGDDDNTIGTTSTIDSRGRGVLQNIDRLNLRGSDIADAADGESVDNIKRRIVL